LISSAFAQTPNANGVPLTTAPAQDSQAAEQFLRTEEEELLTLRWSQQLIIVPPVASAEALAKAEAAVKEELIQLEEREMLLETQHAVLSKDIEQLMLRRGEVLRQMYFVMGENDILLDDKSADDWTAEMVAANREQIRQYDSQVQALDLLIAKKEAGLRMREEVMAAQQGQQFYYETLADSYEHSGAVYATASPSE
jgi:hypothetical protein